jgi:hypothetical protein
MKYALLITLIIVSALVAGCTGTGAQPTAVPTATATATATAAPTVTLPATAQPTAHVISGTVTLNGQPVNKYYLMLVTADAAGYRLTRLVGHTDAAGKYNFTYTDASVSYKLEVYSVSPTAVEALPERLVHTSGDVNYPAPDVTIDVALTQ